MFPCAVSFDDNEGSFSFSLWHNAEEESISPVSASHHGIAKVEAGSQETTSPDYGELTDSAKKFLNGIETQTNGIMAFLFPYVSCYTAAKSGIVNKLNVNKRIGIEISLPSCANPYLALAGLLATGIHGLKNKKMLEGFGELPSSLEEALEAMKNDPLVVDALSKEFVDSFVQLKEVELTQIGKFAKGGG